jgi:Subtilase family
VSRMDWTTRRAFLRRIAEAIPASALLPFAAWGDDETSLEWPDDKAIATGVVRIAVRSPGDRKLPPSLRVFIRIVDKWVELSRGTSDAIYEKEVDTGLSYSIRVTADDHLTIERIVPIKSRLAVARVILVPNGWPYYFSAGVEIPFEPRPRLAGVALGTRITMPAELGNLIARADESGYSRVEKDPDTGRALDDVNGSVLYFAPKDSSVSFFSFETTVGHSHSLVSPIAVDMLRRLFAAYDPRVGCPARLSTGQVRIVDNQYLIRFSKTVTANEVQVYARVMLATVIRELDSGFWLVEFNDPQNLGRHLDAIAQRVKSGDLTSGEPNLLFQLALHGGQESEIPGLDCVRELFCRVWGADKDPYERCQDNLSRQRVEEAWCYIEQYVAGGRYGLPSVRVATIDNGITFASATKSSVHPDVNLPNLEYCYDLDDDAKCTEDASSLSDHDHGMGSYGIIAAKPDNDIGITGIAPNTSHAALKFVSIIANPVRYAETLLWVGGVNPNPPGDRPGARNSPIPPADIISCSHGLDGALVPDLVSNALRRLACEGRRGLGTIVVYSAGNRDEYIVDQNELATNPHTIGVANTEMRASNEVRQARAPADGWAPYASNYSDWIDLCANGELALSLRGNPDEDGPECPQGDPSIGVWHYKGTSAAAAMVAAAAALVLTINPLLNWMQVRSILCASAEKIDCGNTDAHGSWKKWPSQQNSQVGTACGSRGLTWFSEWYGYGRLDVYEAVKLARATLPEPLPTCAPTAANR